MATAVAITRMRALYEATMLAALFSLVTAMPVRAAGRRRRGVHRSCGRCRHQHRAAPRRARADPLPRGGHPAPTALARSDRRADDRRCARLRQPGPARLRLRRQPGTDAIPSPTCICTSPRRTSAFPNTVTSVLASYRGLDTLGELVVVFTAGLAVVSLLGPLVRPEDIASRERTSTSPSTASSASSAAP